MSNYNFLEYAQSAERDTDDRNNVFLPLSMYDRYPLDEPYEFSNDFPFKLNSSSNIFLDKFIDSNFLNEQDSDFIDKLRKCSEKIGNTNLEFNEKLSRDLKTNVYLKIEGSNPSGTFKDRGTITALLFLVAKFGLKQELNIGTVSHGNMAVSTTLIVDKLYELGIPNIQSYIVIDHLTDNIRIELLKKSAPSNGTTIFQIEGEYSKLHENLYAATRCLRNSKISIHAQLTDDVFRASGYSTLFWEIIEQCNSENFIPNYILIPSCSGAFYRAGNFALDKAEEWGLINEKNRPGLIMVQEEGADPINQAYQKKLNKTEWINVSENSIANSISVSNSRSGTACLRILNKNSNYCLSISSDQLLEDTKYLHDLGYKCEISSTASISAIRQLRNDGIIKEDDKIVSILCGQDEKFREIKNSSKNNSTKIIKTDLKNMQNTIKKNYFTKYKIF